MAINEGRIDSRRSYGLLAGILIASVAAGLIVWKVGDFGVQSVFYTIFAVTGVYLIISSFFQDARDEHYRIKVRTRERIRATP